jgi:RNA polymerase sigma-70 factor (ECF subfamily)
LLARIHTLIATLRQPDRSVMLLHLEGLDAAAIGAVTGLSANHVAVKLHRIRTMLARHFASGDPR